MSLVRCSMLPVWIAALVAVAAGAPAHAVTTINFDDRPGMPPPFNHGAPVLPQFLVNDHYASLGVLFDSAGGGIAVCAPSNPVSPPNTVTATAPGPVLSYSDPVFATFQIGSTPAVVDTISITLSDSSAVSALDVYDINGTLLGTATGGASATLTQTFPDLIHSVRIRQGPMAFDDFTFDGLQAVPEPAAATALLALASLLPARRRRRRTAAC